MRSLLALLLAAATSLAAPVPCHVLESGQPGPTVIIQGSLSAGGPAAAYAAHQMRLWHPQSGTVLITAVTGPEELAGNTPPTTVRDLEAPALKNAWRLQLTDDSTPIATPADPESPAIPAAPATLVFTTHAPKTVLAARARQHRQYAFALLQHLHMLAPGVTVETIVDPTAPVRVGVFDGEGSAGAGVPNVLAQLRTQPGVAVTRVASEDIAAGALAQFTVTMFTGGSGSKQAGTLGEAGRVQVIDFVRGGGGYIGICAGSYLACKGFSWGLGILNAKTASPKWQRGRGAVKIELNQQGQKILGEKGGEIDCRYGNGPILVPAGAADLPPFEPLALFRSELAENNTPVGVMINSPAIVTSTFGQGRVLCISPHPEQTAGLEGVIPRAVKWVASSPQ